MNATANQDFYLNFNQYSDLKRDARQKTDGAAGAAAQQFEALFIQQMLKEMRSAAVIDQDQHSSYMDFYTDMYDKQISLMMAKSGGIGLASHMETELSQGEELQSNGDLSVGKFFPLQTKVADSMAIDSKQQGMALKPVETEAEFELELATNNNSNSVISIIDELKQQARDVAAIADIKPLADLATLPPQSSTALAFALQPKANIENKVVLSEEFHQLQNDVDNSVVTLNALGSADVASNTLVDEKIQAHLGWDNPNEFVEELMPFALQASEQLGVKAEVLVAQSALETGWGQYSMRQDDGSIAFSLFGIKADARWQGDTVEVITHEFSNGRMQQQVAEFRAYDSVGEAMQDYVDFIQGSERYQDALSGSKDDSFYVNGLQKAGYATDPEYANKILNILKSDTLNNGIAAINSNEYQEVA